MPKAKPLVTKRTLYSWIFPGNVGLQIILVLIIFITVLARVIPLEMQKRVINEAIKLGKIDLLMIYCGIYLVAVMVASGLKYLSTMLQTIISQRALAQMRESLYHHILTMPLSFFRNTQPGMVVNSLVTELSLPSNFVGMAIAVPATNILTLLAFAGYLFWLNPLLAGVSLSIYPLVIFLLPFLQKRVNQENRRRVDASRALSGRIAESITGIHEIQSNGTYNIENRKFDTIVERLKQIRIRWTFFKNGIKVSNNFFVSLGPFLVFGLGGYLSIHGQLELGALVAFLSAQEKLYDPWKELIEFYQVFQDGSVTYKRTMAYFDIEPDHLLVPNNRDPFKFNGHIKINNLVFETESGIRLIDNVSLSLKRGESLALVGFSGSGKSTLALCIGQLNPYTRGSIRIDDQEVSTMTKRDVTCNIGFVMQRPFVFAGTLEENLLYARSATCECEPNGSESSLPSLDDKIAVLHQAGIFVDTLRFGLNMILNAQQDQDLVKRLIRVRHSFHDNFGEQLSKYVEFYDPDRYLYHSSIAANLTFGTAKRAKDRHRIFSKNDKMVDFFKKTDLMLPLVSLGAELLKQTEDILGNMPADTMFFEQSPISPGELKTYKPLVRHLKTANLHQLENEDREALLKFALRYTPGKHKMVALPEMLESLILEGRSLFREEISRASLPKFTFFNRSEYIYSQTILDNILFGRIKTGNPNIQDKINKSIIQLLIEEDFLETVLEIGMQYQVGGKGENLSGGQRQKLAIARVFLKSPRILIMDEATSALDNTSQARIQNLLEGRMKGKATIISIVHRLDTIKNYDKVAVMKAGKIKEIGSYEELMEKKGALYELIGGRS